MNFNYSSRISEINSLLSEPDTYLPADNSVMLKIKEYYRVPFVYALNSVSGASLTAYETKLALKERIIPKTLDLQEAENALRLSKAYDYMFKTAQNDAVLEDDIKQFYRICCSSSDTDSENCYRTQNVIIPETMFEPPDYSKVPELMNEFVKLMPKMRQALHFAEYSAWLHLNLLNINPFMTLNNVCAVFLSSINILKLGYPPVIIPHVLMKDYYDALKSAQADKEPSAFRDFISEMVFETLRDYARTSRSFIML